MELETRSRRTADGVSFYGALPLKHSAPGMVSVYDMCQQNALTISTGTAG